MRKELLVVAALAGLATAACGAQEPSSQPKAAEPEAAEPEAAEPAPEPAAESEVGEITVAELASLHEAGDPTLAVFDANGADTRSNVGIIPGAVPLNDYRNCADELPGDKDKKLVFYCYNEMCGASHAAAEIAVREGFDDVSVLTAGIMGWKNAGKPLNKL